jgi:hypothetical protein
VDARSGRHLRGVLRTETLVTPRVPKKFNLAASLILVTITLAALVSWSVSDRLLVAMRGHKIVGTVRSGGSAVRGFWLEFRGPEKEYDVQTGRNGQYGIRIDDTGMYNVTFLPRRHLPAGSTQVEIDAADTRIDFDLPSTALWLTGMAPAEPWQLRLYEVSTTIGVAAALTGFVRPGELEAPIRGLSVGQWRVFADTLPNQVSTAPVDVDFTRAREIVARVRIAAGGSELRLRDSAGHPVAGAQVLADTLGFRSDSNGLVSLRRVAPDLPLLIRAEGFVPRCVLAPALSQRREVSLRRPGPAVELSLGPEKSWPFGMLRAPEDECSLSAKFFNTTLLGTGSDFVRVRMTDLADEPYRYWPSALAGVSFQVNAGRSAVIEAPIGCAQCSVIYNVSVRKWKRPGT